MFYGYVRLPEGTLKVSLQLSRSETRVYGDYKYGDVKKGGKERGSDGVDSTIYRRFDRQR